jgi:hypothetical protein
LFFSPRVSSVGACTRGCGTGAVCAGLNVLYVAMCTVLLSAGSVWILCVLLFCVVIKNGVELPMCKHWPVEEQEKKIGDCET